MTVRWGTEYVYCLDWNILRKNSILTPKIVYNIVYSQAVIHPSTNTDNYFKKIKLSQKICRKNVKIKKAELSKSNFFENLLFGNQSFYQKKDRQNQTAAHRMLEFFVKGP